MGNSDSLADRVNFRLLIFTRCHPVWHLQWPPVLPHMASPACHPCYPGSPPIGCGPAMAGSGQMLQPSPPDHRVGNSISIQEATYRYASAATRRFARLTLWAFVRELSASGYPLHLPPATWANCRIPTVGLQPTSHMFYTAYGQVLTLDKSPGAWPLHSLFPEDLLFDPFNQGGPDFRILNLGYFLLFFPISLTTPRFVIKKDIDSCSFFVTRCPSPDKIC